MNRVRSAAYALTAAAALGGATAPGAAVAAPAAHAPHHPKSASDRIPFTEAEVTAGDDGTYRITWKAPGVRHVAVRAGGRTVAAGGAVGSVTVAGLPATDRQWFDLVPERGGGLRLADRLIKLDGAVNFRDEGGYRTADGHWVRMGVAYRSDALDKLTDADVAKLRRLGLHVDYDLRTASERASAPDRLPDGVRYVVADVMGDAGIGDYEIPETADAAVRMMIDGEKSMVSGDSARAAYATVIGGIADGGGGALYHCTAGKDRTGWAGAVLLNALGVPRETVLEDYLASNAYRAEANAAIIASLPADQAAAYKPMLDVRSAYLNSGFDEVRDVYGSFARCQKRALGLDGDDVRKLRLRLLVG